MARVKGSPKVGGRQKGTPNKTTASVRAAIEAAYGSMGGQKRFNQWAESNPDTFYTVLLPKLLPVQVNHADSEGGSIVPVINLSIGPSSSPPTG